MSEIRKADELKADAESMAERAVKQGVDLTHEANKYEPNIQVIWRTHYFVRMTELEKQREIV